MLYCTYVFLRGCTVTALVPLLEVLTPCFSLLVGFSSPDELVETDVEKCLEDGTRGRGAIELGFAVAVIVVVLDAF